MQPGEPDERVLRSAVEKDDDASDGDDDDRDGTKGAGEGAAQDSEHVGSEQVGHRGFDVPGDVRPKKTASKVGLT